MNRIELPGFDTLRTSVSKAKPQIGVAVAGGADSTVLTALALAREQGWIRPLVSGDRTAIAETARRAEVDLSGFEFLEGENAAEAAVNGVATGRAQLLMKGQIDTPALVRALLDPRFGLRRAGTICQVVLMEIVDQRRRFLLSDTGVTIQPTLEQKANIIANTIHVARGLGVTDPRVALVAATEKMNPNMPETVEIVELCRRASAGELGQAQVRGPLSFDLAYASDAGEKKGVAGEVVGAADAMVFPNLLSANLTVKGIMYTAQCRFGGILAGAGCPVVFMSRADTVETRLNSLALALTVQAANPTAN
ncbi:MAG: phosphate acyltransferase [Planctomycetota bacterium]|nr:phosphate acyltransferase [Planctomycetota bacterium]